MLQPSMYNARLFWPRQELQMAAKKVAKRAATSRKKTVTRKRPSSAKKASTRKKTPSRKTAAKKKPTARKKAAAKKKPAAKKKATAKKKAVAKKKAAAKKKVTKKASKKKASAKKTARKASTRKVSGKTSKKKPTARKKTAAKKKAAKRPSPAASRSRATRSDVLTGPIHGVEPYVVKRGEEYMSKGQLEHFHQILSSWKSELMNEVDRTVHHMQDEAANFPDPNDRATQESEFGLELRTRDRERKLIRKINSAISRIEDGSYGYCEETGEEIGLKRLEARPVATLCLEAQERREMAERQFRDRDDRYR